MAVLISATRAPETRMYIGKRVNLARKRAGMTQKELAEKVGIRQSTLSELEQGKSRSTVHLASIARACGVTVQYLEGLTDQPESEGEGVPSAAMARSVDIVRYVPELSYVQAGEWTEIGSVLDVADANHWPCPVKCGPNTFALRVEGPSMAPDYPEGTIIFVDPDVEPESGKKVVAYLVDQDSTTFKQFFRDAGQKYLKAMNPDWPRQYTEINGNCRIIGTVVFAGAET